MGIQHEKQSLSGIYQYSQEMETKNIQKQLGSLISVGDSPNHVAQGEPKQQQTWHLTFLHSIHFH